MKTKEFFEQMKYSNIPDFLGGNIEQLIYNQIIKGNKAYDYAEGWKYGRDEGFSDGVERAIKDFIISGENQIFVTKQGKIIPFSVTGDDLLKNKDVEPLLKNFIEKEKSRAEGRIKSDEFKNIDDIKYRAILDPKEYINRLMRLENMKLKDNQLELNETYTRQIKKYLKNNPHENHPNNSKIYNLSDTHTKYNDYKIEELNKKLEKVKTTSQMHKYFQDEIKKREELRKDINNHYQNLKIINEYDKLVNFTKENNYKNAFNNYKDGKTAILMTDEFNIYNIPQIRKLFGKSKSSSVYERLIESNKLNYQRHTLN